MRATGKILMVQDFNFFVQIITLFIYPLTVTCKQKTMSDITKGFNS